MGIPAGAEKGSRRRKAGEARGSPLLGAEHPGRYPGHEAPRNQPFAVRAKVVGKPRDDIAPAGGQGFEAVTGDRFGGLLAPLRVRRVTRDLVEFRGGSAGAEGADANTVRIELLRQALG